MVVGGFDFCVGYVFFEFGYRKGRIGGKIGGFYFFF